jgi:hypothetical protein
MNRVFHYQGDRRPYLRAYLTRGTKPVELDLAVGVSVKVYSDTSAPPKVNGAANIIDAASALVEYEWALNDLDTPGDFWGCFEVDWGGGEFETLPDEGYIAITVHPKGT